ncbi:MAG: D-3-phosphoglycerate dehydrogenase / 2-oxoglutarate reductase [Thermacetogenium sp.]|jgi:D-3-phosphoglycerate dehydrogenase|nr:D-3-phosphoglycerate dehydrogenase / 2-oxoglutarate reductase [Thermacetogenium sp.]MDN5376260.1 D-3-phosphoglycerate dehydrogenase / 2-oxoglutarate reductase [Thermacetogenium sp.]
MNGARPKILVGDKIVDEALEMLRAEADVDVRIGIGQPELEEIIENYDALIVRSIPLVTEEVIRRGKRLKVVGRAGNGVDNIDVAAATRHGVVVVNTPDSNSFSAGEHTIALMLASARNLPQAHQTVKGGGWGRSRFMGNELYGKTVGIVGLGRIGSFVATRLKAFNMRVIAYDPYIPLERFKRFGAERMETLNDLVRQSDFITVHTPKTEETIGMIGMEQFRIAKKGVRVVNCARGGIIDEEALAWALKEGIVASAALDVFTKEPCTGNPLLEFDNVVVTPHIGATTFEAQHRVGTDLANYVLSALKGEIVPNTVNLPCLLGEEIDTMRPFLELAEYLGRLYYQLEKVPAERVELIYNGEIARKETGILTLAFLKGLLSPVMGDQVNLVNASWLAENRGIKVCERRDEVSKTGHVSLISVIFTGSGKRAEYAGTLAWDQSPRIVRVNGYQLDVVPTPYMLFVEHIDRPGVIGPFASALGEADINIAMMQVARTVKGEVALMILSVDSPVDESTLKRVRQLKGILNVKVVFM